ncbi:kinase-like protein [Aspergillus violaceofuscus CBS 115571]|uniref:Kinase-like protein n=1 Tax=Aspergillus violaceofuscus (strain CBS 115571) TaxID=1450538 RepID=A0A2V5GRH8_ASPV1|nr:kinase-like protein [Aspergillus violaceofuscus CBS 115571]
MLTRRSTVPCSACSFSPERQRCCNYESHVKLFYEAGDRGVWALGSQLILKDRGPSCPTDENANLCFVKKNTTIPIPTVIAHHEEGDGHALTIMTRIPGENLSEAWSKLTDDQKDNIAKETAEYLLQLRSLQSDRLECLDGRPVFNKYRRGEDNCDSAQDPTSDDYVWNRLAASLDPAVPEAVRCRLRRSMPPTQPFTYTHNDLTHVNIMVQNGKLSGIIDWEAAGYYPVWWEYTRTIVTSEGLEDMKWKSLLRQYMPKTREAKCWYLDWFWLCHGVDNERAKELIQEVEENRSEDGVTEKDESEMGEAEEDESDKDDSTEDESMEHKS